ncbi:MAG TPA: SPASM domain-containing protein [Acidimicrobiales bacterium]
MAWPLFDKIVRELGELGYSGWWAFHHCREPLLNPRLVREVEHVRALVPQARPAIHTNGDLLTPGLLVDLLCLGTGYLRVTRYAGQGAPPAHEPVRQWLLEGGLLDSLPWRFVELPHGWAAVFERDGLRIDVIRPRLPAGAAAVPNGDTLPLSTTRPGPAGCRVRPSAAAIDCTGRVAMCRSVFGDAPACGRHTIGNLRERSFADLWSSPTLSAHLDDEPDWDPEPAALL